MASVEESFRLAIQHVEELDKIDDSDDIIKLYSLLKQATLGDSTPKDKPSVFDFKGKSKYEAWVKLKGMSKEEAMEKYVKVVDELGNKYHKKDPNAAAEVNKVVNDALDAAFSGF